MFNIFKSNKMENLMEALASVMSDVPDNPMMPEWIGIQSRGMKQWIAMQTAMRFGVSTNMHFLFPRQMVDHILTSFTPLKNRLEGLNEEVLFWSLMQLIKENKSGKELVDINTYIRGDETGKKLYQLSMKIAKVFDDYQIYRPGMLNDWQSNKPETSLEDPVARWQAMLWNKVVSKNPENHIAFQTNLFIERFSLNKIDKDILPSRMSLFGISALPGAFMQVFEKISDIMDIHLFLLAPSNQFFFDIKSEKQIGRLALEEESKTDPDLLYYEMTNPLLSSLGTSGKGFHASLENFNYYEPFGDLFQDSLDESNTILSVLQSDILNLVHRKQGQDDLPVEVETSDTSICIHACHSPMREAQVLKDLLLNEFEKDSDLQPHDIIVMMPDIEAYAPFIESVFTLETHLPFSISDRRKKSESEPLEAFLKILALKDSRLEQSCVLDLLLSESIAEKFDISFDEIGRIEKMATDAKILWGKDAGHREDLGLPPFEENTWHFGLQRLFMGMAMPENQDMPVNDILPCQSFEGLELITLGKFSAFCDALFSTLANFSGNKTIEKWCDEFKKTTNLLMDRNYKNKEDLGFLIQTIDQLKEDSQRAGFSDLISFDVIHSHIGKKLDQNISQGNFLAGNITFCNIMPMRSIPFKIVVLMGMDEKSFPRQAFNPGFDLIKKYPMQGDKSERDEDRYLFLETLLSARSKFIITYTGMSIQDNSIIPCAGVVSELEDAMAESFVFPEEYRFRLFHPLHPFNMDYFNQADKTGPIFSFSSDNCSIAKTLLPEISGHDSGNQAARSFVKQYSDLAGESPGAISGASSDDLPGRSGSLSQDESEPIGITLDEMIRFFKSPVQGFMKSGLNIKMQDIEEQALDREAFSIAGLEQYSMGSLLIEKKSISSNDMDLYPVFKSMGSLPFGEKGKLEYEKIMKTADPVIDAVRAIADKKQLPPVLEKITMDNLTVSGNFSDIREDGVYFLTYGKLNGARLLSAWISHVFYNIAAPLDYPRKTILTGRDPQGKKPVITCSFNPLKKNAELYFKTLTQIYEKGIIKPFYFFSETSWQFAQALSKDDFQLTKDSVFKAMNNSKTRGNWYGGMYQAGEKENRYVSLCVENNDPFESVETLLSSGFAKNAVDVYKPLLENMEIIS